MLLKRPCCKDFEYQTALILGGAREASGKVNRSNLSTSDNRLYYDPINQKVVWIILIIMGCLGQQEIAIKQEDGQYRK